MHADNLTNLNQLTDSQYQKCIRKFCSRMLDWT